MMLGEGKETSCSGDHDCNCKYFRRGSGGHGEIWMLKKTKGAYSWGWGEEGKQSCLGIPDGYKVPHMGSGLLISSVLRAARTVPSSPRNLFHLLPDNVQVSSFFVCAMMWKQLESRTLECHPQPLQPVILGSEQEALKDSRSQTTKHRIVPERIPNYQPVFDYG